MINHSSDVIGSLSLSLPVFSFDSSFRQGHLWKCMLGMQRELVIAHARSQACSWFLFRTNDGAFQNVSYSRAHSMNSETQNLFDHDDHTKWQHKETMKKGSNRREKSQIKKNHTNWTTRNGYLLRAIGDGHQMIREWKSVCACVCVDVCGKFYVKT